MKKCLLLMVVAFFCVLVGVHGQAQQGYTTVYDLYYQTTLNPETGDQLIQQNRSVFDQQFYACLSQVQQRAAQASHQHQIYCDNTFVDPISNQRCHDENEGAKILEWAETMRAVTRGQVIWSQTTLGHVTIVSKQNMNPNQWAQLVNQFAPRLMPMMVCQ